jgi:hypothetical protein
MKLDASAIMATVFGDSRYGRLAERIPRCIPLLAA